MPSTLGIVSSHYTRPPAPVSLLLQGNGTNGAQNNTFVDSSTTKTITRNGSVTQGSVSPFFVSGSTYNPTINGGSGRFGGTSADYLTVNKGSQWLSRNADWTIECWFNKTANSGTWGGFQSACLASTNTGTNGFEWNIGGSTGSSIALSFKGSSGIGANYTFSLNTWYHTAVVKQGSKLIIFVNGIKLAENASLSNWTDLNVLSIGRLSFSPYFYAFPGYISDLRITDAALYTSDFARPTAPLTTTSNGGGGGTAPTSNQVSLLLNFTNGGVIDSVAKNNLVTVGNAQISTAVKKYGTGSLAFDGSGDYLDIPATPAFDFGAGDFTVEMWVYFNLHKNYIELIDFRNNVGTSVTPVLYTTSTGNLAYFVNGADRIVSSSNLPLNSWVHIALSKSNTQMKMFVNGTQSGSTYTDNNTYILSPCRIGSVNNGILSESTAFSMNGYIDDLRITKGALYTTNFAPGPLSELPTTDSINLNLP